MKAENKNFLYNVAYQICIYIFPLITIPYISRVLGVSNIGVYSYTYSIVNSLMLFAMLGINNYGNREISKVRDDKKELSKKFFSIYSLQLIISFIICLIYIIYLVFFCKEYRLIFGFQFISLISVCFDINWFYFGLEKFKMTINRNLFIKIFSMVLIFLLVKTQNDLWLYTIIMGLGVLLSQIYLVFKLRNYVEITKVSFKEISSHLKGCLILFVPVLAYSIYRIMDKTMIGSMASVIELGYYENSEKLINIPISVITALGTVMLPHMSYLMKNDNDKFKEKINNSMELVLILSTTMAMGLFLISKDVSVIFFGSEYLKSGSIIKILSCTIIISAWASVVRTQFLIPQNKDKIYVCSTIGGAILNLVFNIILIREYGSYGACVGTICAELFVMLYQTILTRKDLDFYKYLNILLKCLAKGFVITGIAWGLTFKIDSIAVRMVLQIIICVILFIIIYYNYIVHEFFNFRKRKK